MSWKQIRGHEHLVEQFARAVARNRLAHAYLFVGPEGVGKRTVALALGKTLLCETPPANEFAPCDQCLACRWFDAGTHPDFHYLQLPPEKHEFPLELIQEVIRSLSVKPARNRYRVVILDDADLLNEESANAFLKTLEEPPPRSLLILLGTSPDFQLPTIRSRCQIVRFNPLPASVIADWLRAEGLVKSQAEANRIANLAEGSLARARLLANPEVWSLRQQLWAALTASQCDAITLTQVLLPFVESAGKDSAAARQRARFAVELILDLLRLALRIQTGVSSDKPISKQDQQQAAALAQRCATAELVRLLDRCLLADFQIDRRLQLALVLEALADNLAASLNRV